MSRTLGLQVLRPDYRGDRIPVMEHPRGLSRQAIRHFSGIDVLAEPARLNEAFRRVAEVFEVDLLWGGGLPMPGEELFDWDDGQTVRANRLGDAVVQWGVFGAVHQEDGRHFTHIPKPADVDDALQFDPLDYFPWTVDDYRTRFAAEYQQALASVGDTCYPLMHHYTTCFHWPLAIFGFELLCEAGLADENRFADLMARFAEVSRRITSAWAQVAGLAGFILHDDLTMTSGPVFPPDWYRRHIFVHYPAIFAPLKAAGVPIIFTSDGNCTALVDDIFAAGADGLNFEYLVDLPDVARRYPDKILIGNLNSRLVADGSLAELEQAIRQCMLAGRVAPRFVVNVGGGLVHDMPPERLEFYLHLRKELARGRGA